MSRSKKAGFVPSYRLHKPSGQARVIIGVIIGGEHIYLGLYGSPESHERYARLRGCESFKNRRWEAQHSVPNALLAVQPLVFASSSAPKDSQPLIAERAASQNGHSKPTRRTNGPTPPIGNPDLQVCERVVAYMKFAKGYYTKDTEKGKECTEIRLALRPLLQLYTNEKARNFGPLALKAVRQSMVESDLSRGVINHRVNKIKRMFKWAVSEELVPSGVYEGLRTVTGLLYGRTTARESEPIKPVEKEWVDAILLYVWPPVAAMIQVQWLAGMRPGEVVLMRPCDIDMSGDIWVYEPLDHKNRWRNHRRLIPLGPKAQAIIRPFLDRPADQYMFSPREGEVATNAVRHKNRKSGRCQSRDFCVDLATHRYRCFKCHSAGRQLDLWAAAHHLSVHAAAEDLCRRLGIAVPWLASSRSPRASR